MRYLALACDYDGTLAQHGRIDDATLAALERVLASGRRLLLATGRELHGLHSVFPRLDLFTWVIAEDGALLYRPDTRAEKLLGRPPPRAFLRVLAERGVPLGVGRVIVATVRPHETAVREAIRDLGLDLEVNFNRDALMVLPAGINKGTGLAAVLKEIGLSPRDVVGVGDAENDRVFLSQCGYAVAVANALPVLKQAADLVTRGESGAGVRELIDRLIADDLPGPLARFTDRGSG
jgi:hydroxymethylpyrimidine pyrophosphatase-like HAD family hydrolase